jgi:stress response protein SCP2
MIFPGDEREGDEEGDDETINVNLGLVKDEVTYLCFVVNSYSGE